MRTGRALVGGQWRETAERFAVTDPATGETVAEVAECGADLAVEAVDAASAALPGWRAMPAHERAAIMRQAAALLAARAQEIGAIMTAEQGKPLAEAAGEVVAGADHLLWAAEETRRVYGETIPSTGADTRMWLLPEPVGVVAGITPWNFPVSMITRKLGPALAAGCTVVLKPSELTPMSAIAVAECLTEAGFPPGVFNLVTTTRPEEFAGAVMADSRVRKVSFTGSTAVGRELIRRSADDVKRLSVELGGHAPVLVFPDADVAAAAAGVARSKFMNAGQACTSPNRIYVHESVAAEFVDELVKLAEAVAVGNGAEPGVTMGPLIDDRAVAKVGRHVEDALARGARLATTRREGPGRFVPPMVLTGVTDDMLVCREETFGPVAPVLTFGADPGDEAGGEGVRDADVAGALARANATPYGLAAYVWTRDLARTMRVCEELQFGIVSVNGAPLAPPQGPFGGIKGSGYGREGGHHGVEDFVEYKYVSVGLGR
ncbi:NAD-dependent succinate-semialdehyde dehydrogenase [Sphaerisporangium krabiense]|uniref:Succinate-semialdehyde dehydrogenase/glutarate-semialdehyde dehydrogenase n=1 Tax=Sphaerisporangium krabiense TaxID=763782 RepID=A0A7W8Z1Z2_9ACTN|nr:NAD-dependent succinate-semialdehyde dehydrogenase [Sphaerisporangium krabiense]MBB5625983.1 succinate-semialdehyde dehydrogenase/glutarate-semialdehyde dehydrogenase [Sphaerisporangium krabiense]GII64786.1 NAD-dependent succinate-semialdehyde dehydrogenase [Sphaerisporangium krabiense]